MYSYDDLQDQLVVFGGFFAIANRLQTTMDAIIPDITARQWFVISHGTSKDYRDRWSYADFVSAITLYSSKNLCQVRIL
jgi:hypothetical protein